MIERQENKVNREKWDEIQRSLHSLSKQYTELSELLDEGAMLLRQGRLPAPTVIPTIAVTTKQFDELCKALKSFVKEMDSIDNSWQQPHSLSDVEGWLALLEAAEKRQVSERQRIQALEVIGQVLTLTHINQLNFAPLTECQTQAEALRKEILNVEPPALHPAVPEILANTHPLSALLQLVDEADVLDDAVCKNLVQNVDSAYDPILGISALRGHIIDQTLVKYIPDALRGERQEENDEEPRQQARMVQTGTASEIQKDAPPDVPDAAVERIPVQAESERKEITEEITSQAEMAEEGIPAEHAQQESDSVTESDETIAQCAQVGTELGDDDDKSAEEVATPDVWQGWLDYDMEELEFPLQAPESTDTASFQTEIPSTQPTDTTAGQDTAQTSADLKEFRAEFGTLLDDIDIPAAAEPSRPTVETVLHEDDIAADADARHVAERLLNSQRPWRTSLLQHLCWQLIHEDKLDLAFHLARCLGQMDPQPDDFVPPELIRLLICARHVRYDVGALSSQIAHDLGYIDIGELEQHESDWADAMALLVASGTARASILAPNSQAWVFLKQLLDLGLPRHPDLAELRSYCAAIANFGSCRQPLDLGALTQVKSQDIWDSELDAFYAEAEAWWESARARTMAFAPATKVWRHWLRSGKLIHELLKPIREQDFSRAEQVRIEAQRLSNPDNVDREIHGTDRRELNRQNGSDIGFTARGQIRLLAEQAVELAKRWLELERSRPDAPASYPQQLIQTLKQTVEQKQSLLEEKFTQLADRDQPLPLRAAMARFRQTATEIQKLFEPDFVLPDQEPPRKYILHGVLLGDADIDLDSEWQPQVGTEQTLYAVLRLAAQGSVPWPEVLERRSNQLDHLMTAYILEYLEHLTDPAVALEALTQQREEHLRRRREAVDRVVDSTLQQVEGAVAYGLLREQERYSYIADIEEVRRTLPKMLQFIPAYRTLYSISREIESMQASQIESVRQRLEANVAQETEAYARISAALDAADPLTANEYIDMVRNNDPLPQEQTDEDLFSAFFPKGLTEIERFLERDFDPIKAVKAIAKYARGHLRTYSLGPVDMYNVPGPQARQVSELLEAWFSSKRSRQLDEEAATTVFDCLGFHTLGVTLEDSRRLEYQVHTEPIRDKSLCPVWQYGSGARGHYRLFCVWDRPTEEELLNKIGETVRSAPVIVFYFGRMTQQRRRDLARLCRERRRTCIVLDDTLLIYLCGFRAPRLSALFHCALPFTFLEPYTVTAGVVPPEMFYGRQFERRSIADEMGACFIYGGRQLGKTALLRDVERNYHDPEQGQVVVWIDLKAEGIGHGRAIDEIWHLLARLLKPHGVIPTSTPAHANAERILEHVENWLDQDPQRRVLLLLDEADLFLESDGRQEEFQHTSRIKSLMDRTNRRFKIVFAGLHNVQRTTTQSNHPLAHYGEPICIGPLLEENEWREARALVENPLLSIGCHFESPDLVTLILSQTNYYPSLIQLYCAQLLRHVMNTHRNAFDSKNNPPYTITSQDVTEVYMSQELRHSIRQRFNWTLQLDQRYEVIAHSVAYDSLSEDGGSLVEGFSDSWLREQALTWWPEGFADLSSNGDMRALADEMVGLGILRTTRHNSYTLRSPNVLLLMGTRDDVEGELLRDREPPIEYEPSAFRSAYRSNGSDQILELTRRSPLTAAQEADLYQKTNGVSLLFGNRTAGLTDLAEFLTITFGTEYTTRLDENTMNCAAFADALGLLRERKRDGTTLMLVSPTVPWTTTWVEEAVKSVSRLVSRTSFARVAFVADPRTTWRLLAEIDGDFDGLREQGVTSINLKPWHDTALRQWLEDTGFGPRDSNGRNTITQVTGNWPLLLQQFYKMCQNSSQNWQITLKHFDDSLEQPEVAQKLLHTLGLQQPEHQIILKTLCDWRDVNDVIEYLDEYPPALIERVLQWADLLQLAHPVQRDLWRVDPVVARLLQQCVQ